MQSSTAHKLAPKHKVSPAELETGSDFVKDDSFNFEIEAEREYVHRLKVQREKVQFWAIRSNCCTANMMHSLKK